MTKRKGFMCLFVIMLMMLFLPTIANASEKVTVYLFRGDGCPHCEEALKFFEKLIKDGDYKDKISIRHLEIWKNDENSDIANKVAEAMGDKPINGSVPYIVVGDKTWSGYSSRMDNEIKNAINDAYQNNKKDKIASIVEDRGELLTSQESDWLTTVIVLVIAVAIIGGTILLGRQEEEETTEENNKKETKEKDLPKKEEKILEEKKEKEEEPQKTEEVKEEKKETKEEVKQTNKPKQNSTKKKASSKKTNAAKKKTNNKIKK